MKQILSFITILFSLATFAQQVGSKVQLTAVDGKTYTGIVKEINGDKYRIKYDGVDFEAWLVAAQFNVVGNNGTQANQATTVQKNGDWQVGDKVEVQDM